MAKKILLELRPEHALQYATMFKVLADEDQLFDPIFHAMFTDLHESLCKALGAQLTLDEIKELGER